jgi:hypothetical protein
MSDNQNLLPAPEGQNNDWLIPILVFFGVFVVILVGLLGNVTGGDTGLSVADKEDAVQPAALPAVAEDASVNFAGIEDGQTVEATFTVMMEATNITVEPAGEINDNAGHFHILIDTPFIAEGEVIPNDETHRHFGDGSTETELTLEPGEHTLRLQLADGAHRAYGEALHDEITITVAE